MILVVVSITMLWGLVGSASWLSILISALTILSCVLCGKVLVNRNNSCLAYNEKRIGALSSALDGIKTIKYMAKESFIYQRIMAARNKEVYHFYVYNVIEAMGRIFANCGGPMLSFGTISLYLMNGGALEASIIFPSILYIDIIVGHLTSFDNVTTKLFNSVDAFDRLNKFLSLEEEHNQFLPLAADEAPIYCNQASWKWPSGEDTSPFKLKDISLGIQRGSTVAIVGKVGSGKSSLLEALLGNLELESGECSVKGRLAYCSQEPWIMSGSIKENITFGQDYHHERMVEIVKACGLVSDLNEFSDGLDTMIGERGINLSGGQKARVALARAIYSDADVYLLDCPLAALDVKISRIVFQKAILGLLKDKTVLMVSHNLSFLNRVDRVVEIDEGRILEQSTFEGIQRESDENLEDVDVGETFEDADLIEIEKPKYKKDSCLAAGGVPNDDTVSQSVSWEVFKLFFKGIGSAWWIGVALIPVLYFGTSFFLPFWVGKWIDVGLDGSYSYYSNIFVIVGFVGVFCGILKGSIPRFLVLQVACFLHDSGLKSVLSAPLSFFETDHTGGIMERFVGDISTIEWSFYTVASLLVLPSLFLANLLLVCLSGWGSVIPICICMVFAFQIYKKYVRFNLDVNRIRPVAKASNMSLFKEYIDGKGIVLAFHRYSNFESMFVTSLNRYGTAYFFGDVPRIWYEFHISALSSVIVLGVALVNTYQSLSGRTMMAGNAISITYSVQLLFTLSIAFQCYSEFESSMASVERLAEYINLVPEKERLLPDDPPKVEWPSKGSIEFKDLKIAYSSEPTIPVLKSINLEIKGGEKIGVVGRTGAGKSTLASTLFRIIDEYEGKVSIDGLDISTVGLDTLRTRLFIILQDPVLFEGTLRSNLDPGEEFTEDLLWEALDTCGLKDHVSSFPLKLEEPITEKGSQFSLGQRQLFMIAIALLKKPKIIVFDESTSAMDNDSDQMIQKVIKEQFKQSTVISIAHRLNTIIEYDRVLVLDQGNVVDFESPSKLLDNPESLFYQMAQATGESCFNDLLSKANISCNTKQ